MSEIDDLQKSFDQKMRELDGHLAKLDEWKTTMRGWKLRAKAYVYDLDLKKLQAENLILKLDGAVSNLDSKIAAMRAEEPQKEGWVGKTTPAQKTTGGSSGFAGAKRRGKHPKYGAGEKPPTVDDVIKKVETVGFEGVDKEYSSKMNSLNNFFKR